ncbi:MAG: glycoside hydrolase family 127 protein, partial [Candidatus Aminicenantes bacterium]|nr:glycoside hydrolase family 127 protein [Candidatus Aminicenantes bacterium]
DQHEAVGHAVRAAYLYAAMTDIAAITHSNKYMPALNDIWKDIVNKKMDVTGGVGTSQFHNEGFGDAYQLFNDKAYCETCSAIAMILWNRRMNWLMGDSKFGDLVELIMYNAGISGVSLTRDRFFYTNPLESNGNHKRKPWFEPGCCPSNMVRFLPEIGSTLYGKDDHGIYINQFMANEATISLKNTKVTLIQKTDYPWKGKVEIQVDPAVSEIFKLNIRIPGWARGEFIPRCNLYKFLEESIQKKPEFILKVNGEKIHNLDLKRGYITINRKWKKKDVVELEFPMNIRVVTGNPKLEDTQGKIALMRGPVVYCMEEVDNPLYFDKTHEYFIDPYEFESEFKKDLLGGVVIIQGKASLLRRPEEIDTTAVPYYSWCNRGAGKMKVWLPANLE